MRYIVVDVEATCWDNPKDQGNQKSEIIQIGLVEVKDDGRYTKHSYMVKPRFSSVSKFCTELTGLTQEIVDTGKSIELVLGDISVNHFLDDRMNWFSYGNYDRNMLTCTDYGNSLKTLYGITYSPFNRMTHTNIKALFALKENLKKEVGLDKAFKHIGGTMTGRHHDGADDAENIQRLVEWVIFHV